MTLHPAEAVRLLDEELASVRGPGPARTEEVWHAFLRFADRPFTVPDAPEADGLLVQYGTYAFDGPRAFTLDLVRQFETCDGDGDHAHYDQVHCELRFAPTPELEALGAFDAWCFRDSGDDLAACTGALTSRPSWAVIRALTPTAVRTYRERV
ncbi:hypothetical protein ACFFSH_07275 [Streptomyces filamentosus]|uniref:Uncharacterized protein n=1 Tax=Streptomyces filamentosus TaxID=67294 RepID=A0A919BLB6_STRFL|nr:hypothetical protein [Streptomyces filamentosus]GHF97910.1 hypothetical protein GCM10017667_30560 [Streptomyces filamentosus]